MQEAYPDVEKARRQAMPHVRLDYSEVERDAAKEVAKMIQVALRHTVAFSNRAVVPNILARWITVSIVQFKSHGQFADMHKAFLDYDKDRSNTLDREELGQVP